MQERVAGRVIRSIHLYEVSIDFEDGASFTVSLVSKHSLECKLTRDEGGEPIVLDKYDVPVLS
jgi:hypothetical protein